MLRDFGRIISDIGKLGHSPKPRGNSNNRIVGYTFPRQSKHLVVTKERDAPTSNLRL